MTRVRVNTDLVSQPVNFYLDNYAPGPGPYSFGYWDTFTIFDQIEDNVNYKDRFGFRPVGPCLHVRFTSPARNITPFRGDSNQWIRPIDVRIPLNPTYLINLLPPVPDSIVEQLAGDAFDAFTTQFPAEISLGNFVWELRELATLVPRLQESISTTAAGGFLNWEFGWKPFLQDLKSFTRLDSAVRERLAYLRSRYGKPTRLGHSVPFCHSMTNGILGTFRHARGWEWQYRLIDYRADWRCGGRLYHTLQTLDGTMGYVRAMIGALGLNNPGQTMWDALPYSFVIDWFTGLGDRLSRLTRIQGSDGDWVVDRVTSSVKQTFRIEVWQHNTDIYYSGPPTADAHVGDIVGSRFWRVVGFPVKEDFIPSLDLDPRRLALLGAMMHQSSR